VTGLPPGARAHFLPPRVTGSGTALLTVDTTASTPPGLYTLTVRGTGAGQSHEATVTLRTQPPGPPSFSLRTLDPSRSAAAGFDTRYDIGVVSTGGFAAPVTLDVIGLPADATATVIGSPVVPGATAHVVVTVSANASQTPGTFAVVGTSLNLRDVLPLA